MEHLSNTNNGNNGIFMMLITGFLYLLNVLTVQEWAGIAAVLAGVSTAAFNGYKFFLLVKHNRKNKKH